MAIWWLVADEDGRTFASFFSPRSVLLVVLAIDSISLIATIPYQVALNIPAAILRKYIYLYVALAITLISFRVV